MLCALASFGRVCACVWCGWWALGVVGWGVRVSVGCVCVAFGLLFLLKLFQTPLVVLSFP